MKKDFQKIIIAIIILIVLVLFYSIFKKPESKEIKELYIDKKKVQLEESEKKEEKKSIYSHYGSQEELKPAGAEKLNLKEEFALKEEITKKTASAITANPNNLINIIESAETNQTINLISGEYIINLTIDKDLNIIGQGETTIFKAKNDKNGIFTINNAKLNLQNLVLKDSRIGVNASNSNINISNIKFYNLSATAFYAKDSEVNFDKNFISSSTSAIKVSNSKGKITNSIIENNSKSGIMLYNNSNFVIENNKIINNGSYGIFADRSSDAKIENNFINNKGYNVRLEKTREIYD